MNIAIIGAGLIGKKRALALPSKINLKTICDIDEQKGKQLAKELGCNFEKNWQVILEDKKINAVFICTTNNYLSKIAVSAIKADKHVLVEKPGARNIDELQKIVKAYQMKKVVVMFGFNHRYHPAILKAKALIDYNKFGKVLFIRARYGHGGRLGYEKEWRFKKDISGGGELLDQGSHLIDLVNFFCGRMNNVVGLISHLFWKSKVEDSAFFILSNKRGQVAQLSATWVEWKNIFSLEIVLKGVKIQIDGLGGSYGREKLTLYKMKPEMGPPDMEEFLFNETDNSWIDENNLFFQRIKQKDYSDDSLKDALYVMSVIKKLYHKNLV